MYFEEHRIALLANDIADQTAILHPETFASQEQVRSLHWQCWIFVPFRKTLGQAYLQSQNIFGGFI